MDNPLISIIVPTKSLDQHLSTELIPSLTKQIYKKFELLLVPDTIDNSYSFPDFVKVIPFPGYPGQKRDFAAKHALGSILVFLDSDAFPVNKSWLSKAIEDIQPDSIAAVCGPGLTPQNDSLLQQMSGYTWTTWFGAGGADLYRNIPQPSRYVSDYPTFNFIIKKQSFNEIGGFDTPYWPGEDTVLCEKLVFHHHQKILYDPKIPVYHHRRSLWKSHIHQISRYGLHRGYFAKIYPHTSRKLGYLLPSLFVVYQLILILILIRASSPLNFIILVPLLIYLIGLFATALRLWIHTKRLNIASLLIPAIYVTHCTYGFYFLYGLFLPKLKR